MKSSLFSESHTRWWDPLVALLFICILLAASARLVVTEWTDNLTIVRALAIGGGILGLVLGQTRFSPRTAFFYAFSYALFLIPWQLGSTLIEELTWKERLWVLGDRLVNTVEELLLSKAVSDNILFLFLMACLFWAFCLHAGYTLTRHANAWRAILPIGFTVVVIQAYDPYLTQRAGLLAALLLFSILLLARTNFIQRQAGWKSNRTYIPPDIGYDWIRFTLVVAILIVAVAWTFPVLADSMPVVEDAWQTARRPWVELQDRMSNFFASLRSTTGLYHEYYSDSFSLGLGTSLSEEPVLAVQAPARGFEGLRFYWRAYAYDLFEGGKWQSTAEASLDMGPEESEFLADEFTGRLTSSFVFIPQRSIATLFTAPQPLWVNRASTASVSNTAGDLPDIVSIEPDTPVLRGEGYEVRSSLIAATETQLREAGTDYPAWVTERYLQLPDHITARTVELAESLAADHDNPYDIAVAVTNHLRSYEYSEIIEAPPADREVVDWWLFEYQKGFCQYYATSQVILLRILGIPARFSVGYAEGELRREEGQGDPRFSNLPQEVFIDIPGTYVVRQKEAHAWPEVYFSGIGWVEFEPTASQLQIFRPSGVDSEGGSSGENPFNPQRDERDLLAELDDAGALPDEAASQFDASSTRSYSTLISLVALAILVLLYANRRKIRGLKFGTPLPVRLERGLNKMGVKSPGFLRRWVFLSSLPPIFRSYMEINQALKRLGSPAGPHDTPAERAAALLGQLPEVEHQVEFLLEKYQRSIYSQSVPEIENARKYSLDIRWESYRGVLRNFIQKFPLGKIAEGVQSLSRSN